MGILSDGTNNLALYIIILNWNQYSLTTECVRSLRKVTYNKFRIVVVDNASRDNSLIKLREEFNDSIDIITNKENLGYAGGNNVGIQYALGQGADYVMLLNNDTIVAPTFIEPLLKVLQSNHRVGAVTPKIYFQHNPNIIWAAGGEINWWLGKARSRGKDQLDTGQFDQQETVDYATGCCVLMSRSALQKIGLLDERYFAYFEDADWSVRARQAGFDILYVPTSRIWHIAGASTRIEALGNNGKTSPITYYLNARNNLLFIKRYTKSIMRLTALISFFFRDLLFYTMVFLLLRRWGKLKSLWRGAFEGWRLKDYPSDNTR